MSLFMPTLESRHLLKMFIKQILGSVVNRRWQTRMCNLRKCYEILQNQTAAEKEEMEKGSDVANNCLD